MSGRAREHEHQKAGTVQNDNEGLGEYLSSRTGDILEGSLGSDRLGEG